MPSNIHSGGDYSVSHMLVESTIEAARLRRDRRRSGMSDAKILFSRLLIPNTPTEQVVIKAARISSAIIVNPLSVSFLASL